MTFWKHWVRTPALAVTAGGLFLGATGSLDWSAALPLACMAALTAKAASTVAKRKELAHAPAKILEFPARSRAGRYDRAA
jgi:hypothetical protein